MKKQEKNAMFKKIAVIFCAVVLIVAATVSGTIAWLTAETAPVTNTFTVGNINITLTETTGDSYKILPGNVLKKNPKVSVAAGSEKCYLFVLFKDNTSLSNYYTSNLSDNNGWTKGSGNDGIPTNVWFRVVDSSDVPQEWDLIQDNKITIPDSLTKDVLNSMDQSQTITYMACAVQYYNNGTDFTPAEAYGIAPDSFKSTASD